MVVTLDADARVPDADGADAQLSTLRSRLAAAAAADSAGAHGSRGLYHVTCIVSHVELSCDMYHITCSCIVSHVAVSYHM
jgi:hypothetical protein